MKGNNTLILNTATMIDAVEEYLKKRLVNVPLKVMNVSPSLRYDTDGTFEITTSDKVK